MNHKATIIYFDREEETFEFSDARLDSGFFAFQHPCGRGTFINAEDVERIDTEPLTTH